MKIIAREVNGEWVATTCYLPGFVQRGCNWQDVMQKLYNLVRAVDSDLKPEEETTMDDTYGSWSQLVSK